VYEACRVDLLNFQAVSAVNFHTTESTIWTEEFRL